MEQAFVRFYLWTGSSFFFISFFFYSVSFVLTPSPVLFRLTTRSALIIPNGARSLGTTCQRTTGNISRHSQGLVLLGSAIDVIVVPHLVQLRAPVVTRTLAGFCLVVLGTAAAEVGNYAVLAGQRGLNVRKCVGGPVGGVDVGGGEPAPGGEGLVVGNDGLVELEEVVVFAGLGSLYDIIVSWRIGIYGRVVRRVIRSTPFER